MNPADCRLRLLVIEADSGGRQALVRRFSQHALVQVVGESRSFATAMPRIAGLMPDWIVMSLAHDSEAGVAFLRELTAARSPCALAVVMPAGMFDGRPDLVQTVRSFGVKVLVRASDGSSVETEYERLGGELLAQLLRASGDPASARRATPGVGKLPAAEAASRSARAVEPGAAAGRPAPSTSIAAAARSAAPSTAAPVAAVARASRTGRSPAVVGIGVSTGGPTALAALLPELPADFPLPILIVQHMPPQFTRGLAESLSRSCRLPVEEAQDGDIVRPRRILIAPGGRHLRVVRRDGEVVTSLTDDPPECSCRPSVDYLFRSLVAVYGAQVLGVVLTGMGEDGWIGSRVIRSSGGAVLAQDEASCTVYGMPRGPIQEGLAEAVPLSRMAGRIFTTVGGVPCS